MSATPRAESTKRSLEPAITELVAKTIKGLAMDAVEAANSGHPGMPMGCADLATVLWTEFHTHDPRDPNWFDRDRFVLSAGHGSMLLYALLHLTGYDLSLDELQQLPAVGLEDRRAPGVRPHPGRRRDHRSARLGLRGRRRHGHRRARSWPPATTARVPARRSHDLRHRQRRRPHGGRGVRGGEPRRPPRPRQARLPVRRQQDLHRRQHRHRFSEDVGERFEAYGWHVLRCDGHDHAAIRAAIQAARAQTERPSLICCRTTIANGAPTKAGTSDAHGAPLGAAEVAAAKQAMGWPATPNFHVPAEVREALGAQLDSLAARERPGRPSSTPTSPTTRATATSSCT